MNDTLIIKGGHLLKGTIKVSGSKNAALALIPAALLAKQEVTLTNVPDIEDIRIMLKLCEMMNVKYHFANEILIINAQDIKKIILNDSLVNALRASTYFMGVYLALFNEVEIIAPGGCKIGERPIDYHLEAFKNLGANVDLNENIYHIYCKKLQDGIITLPYPSVGTTINLLLASFFIDGITIIENVALEPEVDEVIDFLNAIGGKISGKGQGRLVIEPKDKIKGITYQIMNDRIEAGTYAILGALIGEELTIEGFELEHSLALLNIFNKLGIKYSIYDNCLTISKGNKLNPINLKTFPYPYFPTDLQQPLTVLLSKCINTSIIEDTVYKKRSAHLEELKKMNFDVHQENNIIYINPSNNLVPAEVIGKDLRGSAALICAALLIEGESIIHGYQYLKRGYVDIVNKIKEIGGEIDEKEKLDL